jgi:hypothetical protein
MHASHWMTTRFNCSRNLPSTRSWSFLARSPEKKWVDENVSFRSFTTASYSSVSMRKNLKENLPRRSRKQDGRQNIVRSERSDELFICFYLFDFAQYMKILILRKKRARTHYWESIWHHLAFLCSPPENVVYNLICYYTVECELMAMTWTQGIIYWCIIELWIIFVYR